MKEKKEQEIKLLKEKEAYELEVLQREMVEREIEKERIKELACYEPQNNQKKLFFKFW